MKKLIMIFLLGLLATGCVGGGPHLLIGIELPETEEEDGGLPGVPTFPDQARHSDHSGVAESDNHVGIIMSAPRSYQGISASENYFASDAFFEYLIQQVTQESQEFSEED